MGCDIHPVLEKKWTNPNTGETNWVGVHAYPYTTIKEVWIGDKPTVVNHFHVPAPQGRNYRLFAKLAGVRGDGPDPRGLPEDASDLALMSIGNTEGDLHSHSWATAREWVQACLAIEPDPEKLFLSPDSDDPRVAKPYEHYLELEIYEDEESPDDYRIVFAFDN